MASWNGLGHWRLRVDTVTQMDDDKLYLPLDLRRDSVFELMRFKCLVFIALMALCKQRTKTPTQLKCEKIALAIGDVCQWNGKNWWLVPKEMS